MANETPPSGLDLARHQSAAEEKLMTAANYQHAMSGMINEHFEVGITGQPEKPYLLQ